MNKLISTASCLLRCPVGIFGFLASISALSLTSALIAQHVFGLEPCTLCLYQRVPFVIGFVIGVLGLLLRKNKALITPLIGLGALTFLSNSIIAFYHSGVERHWWRSFLEGCAVPDMGDDPARMMEMIMKATSVPCDAIPWADPIFGLSMANYNAVLCFGIFVLCMSAIFLRRTHQAQNPHH